MKRILIVIVVLLVLGSVSFGASFGAFGGISTGVGFTPTFYVPFDPFSVAVDLIGSLGIIPNADLQINLSTLIFSQEGFAWGGLWIMPRYDLGGLSILNFNVFALKLSYSDGFGLGVEYHTELGILKDLLSIEFNLGLGVIPSLNLYSIVSPVLYLSSILGVPLALYYEADISSDFSGVGVGSIIGIFFSKDNISLNLGYDFSQRLVGWVSISF